MQLKIPLMTIILAFGAGCGEKPRDDTTGHAGTTIVDAESYRQSVGRELDKMVEKPGVTGDEQHDKAMLD